MTSSWYVCHLQPFVTSSWYFWHQSLGTVWQPRHQPLDSGGGEGWLDPKLTPNTPVWYENPRNYVTFYNAHIGTELLKTFGPNWNPNKLFFWNPVHHFNINRLSTTVTFSANIHDIGYIQLHLWYFEVEKGSLCKHKFYRYWHFSDSLFSNLNCVIIGHP